MATTRAILLGLLIGILPIVLLVGATAGLVPPSAGEASLALGAADADPSALIAGLPPASRSIARATVPAGGWQHDQLADAPAVPAARNTVVPRRTAVAALPPFADAANPTAAEPAVPPSLALLGRPISQLGRAVPAAIRRWEGLIVDAAAARGLDPNLVAALMMTESGGDPRAVSPKGAIGLMQVVGGSVDPAPNVEQGTSILSDNLARYGRPDLALAAYNAGSGAVDQYGGIPPYRETRDHVFRVLLRYQLYSK
jgi:soluble lytic murein transglycosylase-like protein